MENITPLQLKAQQLREEYKRADEKQQQLQDILALERKKLINKFSFSFSSLYSLLISSNIRVDAEISSAPPMILLTYKSNTVSIGFERTSHDVMSWTLLNKTFKATLTSKELGKKTITEDEDRLTMLIEDLLFTSPSTKKEQENEVLSITYPASQM